MSRFVVPLLAAAVAGGAALLAGWPGWAALLLATAAAGLTSGPWAFRVSIGGGEDAA